MAYCTLSFKSSVGNISCPPWLQKLAFCDLRHLYYQMMICAFWQVMSENKIVPENVQLVLNRAKAIIVSTICLHPHLLKVSVVIIGIGEELKEVLRDCATSER